MTKGNDFANPSTHQNEDGTHDFSINKGLTKREYFAAMAMQGILASNTAGMSSSRIDIFAFAEQGVKAADALIKALNETQQ